jgi:hypothetical protein
MGIKLEKDMYLEAQTKGLSFADFLEELDPSERDPQDKIVGLTAWQRQLKEYGIKTSGPNASTLEKFFATSSSTVLFPHYVSTQIHAGILAASIVPAITAARTKIESHTYDGLWMAETEQDRQLRRVDEGVHLPTVEITTAEHSVKLKKFGRMLQASYEALRLTKLPVISVFLQRIGAQLGIDESDWALQTIIAGDGNSNGITDTNVDVTNNLDYDDMTKLWLAFGQGYECNVIIAIDAMIRLILNLNEFKDPYAGFRFQAEGKLINPLGAQLIRWASAAGFYNGATAVPEWIIAIDKRYCLEEVYEQDVMVENDKLINKQLERTTVSKWSGFVKLDVNAAQALDTII